VTEQPLLSIVITSYTTDRLKDIFELLDSIKAQAYPRIETNFVVERSVELLDKVKAYAMSNNIPNFKALFNDGESGLSAARNVGIKQAQGDIIAFVDDDVVLFPDWAEQMVKAYNNDSIIGVTGPAFPSWEDPSMSWFPEEFYWIISCTAWTGWKEVREVRNAWGHSMSFRKDAFEQAELFLNNYGYHKGPTAEDNEFSFRIKTITGKKLYYYPDIKVWHKVHKYRLSTEFIKERSYWIGYSRRMLKKACTKIEKDQNIFQQECDLLKRILKKLLPSIIKTFFTHPVTAWRQLKITVIVLTFVALGYLPHFFTRSRSNKLSISAKGVSVWSNILLLAVPALLAAIW